MPSPTHTVDRPQARVSAEADGLRVLSVIPGQSSGPSMIFAKRQTQSLQGTVVTNSNFFLSTRTSPTGLFGEFCRFRQELRRFQPHVIHAHFGTVTALFCAVSTSLPLVITFRGSDLNPCPSMNWLRAAVGRLFSHLAAIRARRIICVSEELRQRLWWRRQGINVIPTGVDTDVFYPRSRDAARRRLGWDIYEQIVLFNAGKTPAVKRLDLARAGVAEARKLAGDIRFVVLDGNIDPQQLPLMMNASDCLLLTSDWEGSPTVVQEAMACNLPVVSVDVGDVRDRLRDVRPTAIVSRDAKALGQAISQMLAPPRRSNGWLSADQLSLKVLAQQLIEIYRAAVSGQTASIQSANVRPTTKHLSGPIIHRHSSVADEPPAAEQSSRRGAA